MMRSAAVLAWTTGLGFGLPGLYAIWYLADRGLVWTFLGFPTYAGEPFERIGIDTTVPLLGLFLLVCVAELAAGWLLWQHRRAGVLMALALLPIEFAFWLGFALPLGPLVGLARTALVLTAWSRRARTAPPEGSCNEGQVEQAWTALADREQETHNPWVTGSSSPHGFEVCSALFRQCFLKPVGPDACKGVHQVEIPAALCRPALAVKPQDDGDHAAACDDSTCADVAKLVLCDLYRQLRRRERRRRDVSCDLVSGALTEQGADEEVPTGLGGLGRFAQRRRG